MTSTQNSNRESFVLLQMGGRRLAVPTSRVTELSPPVRLHRFPHTSERISGVIVRRGKIVSVCDASAVLGLRRSSSNSFYLIAENNIGKTRELFGIPVNGECELVSGEVHPPPPTAPNYISGEAVVGDERFDVLDLDALLAAPASVPNQPAQPEVRG
jgi:chemotaxis signal transduction protein